MSHDLGGVGFIERENATIINAALKKCMQQGFQELTSVLNDLKIHCPLYVTQNNGTILPLEKAILYPLLTISAGPTNSFIGAAKLAALNNAVIADIGGTSTDVGIVLDGFARRSINTANIAGISLNFSMPDVLSIALGGGSYVKLSEGCMAIGPESCGKNIKRESRCFGGNALTLTDIAVAEGLLSMEGVQIPVVEKSLSRKVFGYIENQLRELKRKMAGIHKDLPLIVVGGGAELLRNCSFAQEYIIPDHANVANAYGAALAEVSGTVDTVISLINRDKIIADLTAQAIDQAQKNGAQKDTIRIIDKYILPFHYMPHNLARVRIVAVGKRKQ
jgi:N-methylhydantoinase A/oxoprolinase/acetone carboxylase beta subunit